MNRIENMADLKMEIRRLEVVKASQERAISKDIREIQESLSPGRMMREGLSSFFAQSNESGSLIKGGVNMGVSFLIEKILMKNSGPVMRNIVSFLATNMASNFAAKNADGIVGKVKDYIGKLFGKKDPQHFDSTYQEREIYNNEY